MEEQGLDLPFRSFRLKPTVHLLVINPVPVLPEETELVVGEPAPVFNPPAEGPGSPEYLITGHRWIGCSYTTDLFRQRGCHLFVGVDDEDPFPRRVPNPPLYLPA